MDVISSNSNGMSKLWISKINEIKEKDENNEKNNFNCNGMDERFFNLISIDRIEISKKPNLNNETSSNNNNKNNNNIKNGIERNNKHNTNEKFKLKNNVFDKIIKFEDITPDSSFSNEINHSDESNNKSHSISDKFNFKNNFNENINEDKITDNDALKVLNSTELTSKFHKADKKQTFESAEFKENIQEINNIKNNLNNGNNIKFVTEEKENNHIKIDQETNENDDEIHIGIKDTLKKSKSEKSLKNDEKSIDKTIKGNNININLNINNEFKKEVNTEKENKSMKPSITSISGVKETNESKSQEKKKTPFSSKLHKEILDKVKNIQKMMNNQKLSNGVSEFKLTIRPELMDNIKVSIDMSKNSVIATFVTGNIDDLSALSESRNVIESALESNNFSKENQNLNFFMDQRNQNENKEKNIYENIIKESLVIEKDINNENNQYVSKKSGNSVVA